jgi:hypothetical protein
VASILGFAVVELVFSRLSRSTCESNGCWCANSPFCPCCPCCTCSRRCCCVNSVHVAQPPPTLRCAWDSARDFFRFHCCGCGGLSVRYDAVFTVVHKATIHVAVARSTRHTAVGDFANAIVYTPESRVTVGIAAALSEDGTKAWATLAASATATIAVIFRLLDVKGTVPHAGVVAAASSLLAIIIRRTYDVYPSTSNIDVLLLFLDTRTTCDIRLTRFWVKLLGQEEEALHSATDLPAGHHVEAVAHDECTRLCCLCRASRRACLCTVELCALGATRTVDCCRELCCRRGMAIEASDMHVPTLDDPQLV